MIWSESAGLQSGGNNISATNFADSRGSNQNHGRSASIRAISGAEQLRLRARKPVAQISSHTHFAEHELRQHSRKRESLVNHNPSGKGNEICHHRPPPLTKSE